MQKVLNYLTWGFLLVFLIPSTLIVASWNALPGDLMYSTKLALESTLMFVVRPSYAASGTLSIKFTERRFAEARQLLANKSSVEGLPYLERQVIATKIVVDRASNSNEKRRLAKTYLSVLRDFSGQLEQQKQSIGVGTASSPAVPTISVSPTYIPTEPTPSASPSPQPTPAEEEPEQNEEITSEIEGTQETIEETIEDLEEIIETESMAASEEETEEENQEDNGEENNSQEQGERPKNPNQGQGSGQGQGQGQ